MPLPKPRKSAVITLHSAFLEKIRSKQKKLTLNERLAMYKKPFNIGLRKIQRKTDSGIKLLQSGAKNEKEPF